MKNNGNTRILRYFFLFHQALVKGQWTGCVCGCLRLKWGLEKARAKSSIYCSPGRFRFSSQHPHSGSQTPVTPGVVTSSGLLGTTPMWSTYTHIYNHTCIHGNNMHIKIKYLKENVNGVTISYHKKRLNESQFGFGRNCKILFKGSYM